jgi:hypothetical protein
VPPVFVYGQRQHSCFDGHLIIILT